MYNDHEARMERAFCYITTLCSIDCQCGRVHFTSAVGHGDYEPGELEALKEKARQDPNKYVEHFDYDSVDTVFIDGKQLVPDCVCGEAERYAKWIEKHADGLADYLVAYLKDKAERLKRESDDAHRRANSLAAAN